MITLKHVLDGQKKTLELISRFFLSEAIDPELFKDIQQVCDKGNRHKFHSTALNFGYLSIHDFLIYAGEKKWITQEKALKPYIAIQILDALASNFVLLKNPQGLTIHEDCYKVNAPVAIELHRLNLIDNLLMGFEYIYEKYAQSIFKIVVSKKSSDPSIGTGFLYRAQTSNQSIIVTNKHVVENMADIEVIDEKGAPHEILRLEKDTVNDIAIIFIKSLDNLGLSPNQNLKVLESVITMGYPTIPTANGNYLCCHSGEINSLIQTYFKNDLFILSSRTAPGASGSPVLDKTGRFIGVIAQEMFNQGDLINKGITAYSAAIPAKNVVGFIESVLI